METLEIPRLEKTAHIRHLNHKNGITILQYRRKFLWFKWWSLLAMSGSKLYSEEPNELIEIIYFDKDTEIMNPKIIAI